jgi:hypothetical protein
MYGGFRPKPTGLLANFDISSLAILCDDLHEHAPWRSSSEDEIHFHTSEEAAYPQLFCTAVANLLADLAVAEGFSLPPFDLFDTQATNSLYSKHLLRGSVGVQPRGVQFSFHLHSMTLGSLKTSFLLFVHLRRSFLLRLSKALPSLLSSSLMMGPVPELSSTSLQMTKGR